jgi:hypothetical protein
MGLSALRPTLKRFDELWANSGRRAKGPCPWRMARLICDAQRLWPGVRWAGLPKAEPGADAGPATGRGVAALIQARLDSAIIGPKLSA